MDQEDRAAYIKEQKAKLGLNNNVLLKSSKRAIINSQLQKDMGHLEFNGLYRALHIDHNLFLPHEMAWSGIEYIKEDHQEFLTEEQEIRAMAIAKSNNDKLRESMKEFKQEQE